MEKRWQFVPKKPPRILFSRRGHPFRRVRGYPKLIKHMLPRLDLLVTFDWRMSNTARYSDYVLPAAGWYEKDDITLGIGSRALQPRLHRGRRPGGRIEDRLGVPLPVHEEGSGAAPARAVSPPTPIVTARSGVSTSATTTSPSSGASPRTIPEDLLEEILELSTNLGGIDWQELKQKGYERFTGVGMGPTYIGNAADIEPDETIVANSWHVQRRFPGRR